MDSTDDRSQLDPYQRAIADGTPALALLANSALLGAEASKTDELEGLTVAALFSRMAAETDLAEPREGHAHVVHGEVMLMRERYDRDHGRAAQAAVAGACAMRAFTRAADFGNEAAATRLTEITPRLLPDAVTIAKAWETPEGAAEQALYDGILRAAAGGDADALITIMGEAVSDRKAGVLTPIEALAIIEQCGRLGSAAGHTATAVHLAHALDARSVYERGIGHRAAATYKQADCILVLSMLERSGHPGASETLSSALALAPMKTVALAAQGSPAILSALSPQGAS